MSLLPCPVTDSISDEFNQQRARLRNNQRNSRARKQAYLEELEKKWSQCVRTGAEATVEMQAAARKVQHDNEVLKAMLIELGVTKDQINARLKPVGSNIESASGILAPKPCCTSDNTSCGPAAPTTPSLLPVQTSSAPDRESKPGTPTSTQIPQQQQQQYLPQNHLQQPLPQRSAPRTPTYAPIDPVIASGTGDIRPHDTSNIPQYTQPTSYLTSTTTFPPNQGGSSSVSFEPWLTDLYDPSGNLNQDFSDAFDTFIDASNPQAQSMTHFIPLKHE